MTEPVVVNTKDILKVLGLDFEEPDLESQELSELDDIPFERECDD